MPSNKRYNGGKRLLVLRFVDESNNREVFRQHPNFQVFALGEYIEGDEVGVWSVHDLVGLQKEDLKPSVNDILDRLNQTEMEAPLTSLSRAIHGHYQFQDILGVSLEAGLPWQNRNYCYYESLVYLRESAVSWLDGNVLAATTLLRPFMELTILHLYWYSRSLNEGYRRYYDWLAGNANKPPFRNQVEHIFDNVVVRDCLDTEYLERSRDNILDLYKWGCIYNHTPKVEESLFHVAGGGRGNEKDLVVSLAYYPLVAAPLIREVVHTFMLVYPMSFFPVNRYEKWGFGGGPTGFFVDSTNGLILSEAIGKDSFESIASKIEHSSAIKPHLDDFAGEPELTEEELEDSWTKFCASINLTLNDTDAPAADLWAGRVSMAKSSKRGIGWAINYAEDPPNIEDFNLTS